MVFLIIFLSILVIILLVTIVITHLIVKMIVKPRRYSRKEQYAYNEKKNYNLGVSVLDRTPITFKMKDGYIINGDYSLIDNSKRFCILVHGHGTTREGALRYSLIMHELGFSTIIYDQRSHGDNVWKNVSMGYQESNDLKQIIDFVYQKFGDDIYLGIQGTSMGGATALLALNDYQNIKFCISDCAYANFKSVLIDSIKKNHLPTSIFLHLVNMSLRTFYKWSINDVCPSKNIEKTHIPILFIHGDKDTYVSVENAHILYESCNAKKELWIVKGASHAESITIEREQYKMRIKQFIDNLED